jgi:integrase
LLIGLVPTYRLWWVPIVQQHAARFKVELAGRLQSKGLVNPCTSHEVREEVRGIRNTVGTEQRRVAPAMRDELMAMVDRLEETTAGVRDKALLLVGFSAALRRSELAALTIQRLQFDRRGLMISLDKSKTDQAGAGAAIAVPRAKVPAYCPVGALRAWLAEIKRAKHDVGPVFRRISKAGTINADPLNAASIARIVKGHAMKAGLDPALYSGHSLRAGLATSSAQEGKAFHKIKAQTRHKSDATVLRYVRDGELFKDNAADLL